MTPLGSLRTSHIRLWLFLLLLGGSLLLVVFRSETRPVHAQGKITCSAPSPTPTVTDTPGTGDDAGTADTSPSPTPTVTDTPGTGDDAGATDASPTPTPTVTDTPDTSGGNTSFGATSGMSTLSTTITTGTENTSLPCPTPSMVASLPPPTSSTPGTTTIVASPPGQPQLLSLQSVTNQADNTSGVLNSWGPQKNRLIRLDSGDIFTVYKDSNNTFYVMHRSSTGSWDPNPVFSDASGGIEPLNIVRGLHDDIHIFAHHYNENDTSKNMVVEYLSTDRGKSFQTNTLPGDWSGADQGYAGTGVNALGDMVFAMTGPDSPAQVYFDYYSHVTKQWTFHSLTLDPQSGALARYTYLFCFPGPHNDLVFTGRRDAPPTALGYPNLSNTKYLFDAVGYMYIPDINRIPSDIRPSILTDPATYSFQNVLVVKPQGETSQYADISDESDAYLDTTGRLHILCYNAQEGANGMHEIIIANGQKTDVPLSAAGQPLDIDQTAANKLRLTQDTQGHFYLVNIGTDNSLEVYPATADDTDGTRFNAVIHLDNSQLPGCTDHDACHSPTFTVPRSGNAISDVIDGVYGNQNQEIFFEIKLR